VRRRNKALYGNSYYMSDPVNSTRVVTDEGGNEVYAAAYGPFGELQKTWENGVTGKWGRPSRVAGYRSNRFLFKYFVDLGEVLYLNPIRFRGQVSGVDDIATGCLGGYLIENLYAMNEFSGKGFRGFDLNGY